MQVVPVEEASHFAVRLLQTPSTSPNAVPDNVIWLDLEAGFIQFFGRLPFFMRSLTPSACRLGL